MFGSVAFLMIAVLLSVLPLVYASSCLFGCGGWTLKHPLLVRHCPSGVSFVSGFRFCLFVCLSVLFGLILSGLPGLSVSVSVCLCLCFVVDIASHWFWHCRCYCCDCVSAFHLSWELGGPTP